MKSKFLFCLIAVCFFAKGFCQTDTANLNARGIIKVYPLQLGSGEVRASYEKPLKHNMSLELGCGYIYRLSSFEFGAISSDETEVPANGFTLREGVKFYFSENQDHYGLYFLPLIMTKYFIENNPYYTETINEYGLQSLIGYMFHSKNKFSFEVYGGLGIKKVIDKSDSHISPSNHLIDKSSVTVLIPQFGFSIGYKPFKNK